MACGWLEVKDKTCPDGAATHVDCPAPLYALLMQRGVGHPRTTGYAPRIEPLAHRGVFQMSFRSFLVAAATALVLPIAGLAEQDSSRAVSLKSFQGVWKATEIVDAGESKDTAATYFVFDGDRLSTVTQDQCSKPCSITVQATAVPTQLLLWRSINPTKGIAEVTGDQMRLCLDQRLEAPFPVEFLSLPETQVCLMSFVRIRNQDAEAIRIREIIAKQYAAEAAQAKASAGDGGVLAIVIAVTLPLLCVLIAAGLTACFQRVRPDWARWVAIAITSSLVIGIASAMLAAMVSSLERSPAQRGVSPNTVAIQQIESSVGALCGMVFALFFVLAIASAFKARAVVAPRAIVPARILAAATCAGGSVLWIPAVISFRRLLAGPHLSAFSVQAFGLMFAIAPYTFLIASVWGVGGLLIAAWKRMTASAREGTDTRATPSPPPTPPSGS